MGRLFHQGGVRGHADAGRRDGGSGLNRGGLLGARAVQGARQRAPPDESQGLTLTSQLVAHLQQILATYGYFAVLAVVGMESLGVPIPGETALVAGAIL